jgi:hypothetical protein
MMTLKNLERFMETIPAIGNNILLSLWGMLTARVRVYVYDLWKIFHRQILHDSGVFCRIFWPIFQALCSVWTISKGRFTLAYLAAIFSNRLYLVSIGNSIFLAMVNTAITFRRALPLIYCPDRSACLGVHWMLNIILLKTCIIDGAHFIDWLSNYRRSKSPCTPLFLVNFK